MKNNLLHALETILAMATPVNTLPHERCPVVDFPKLVDAIANVAQKAIARACPDSPSGEHAFSIDLEYDPSGNTESCEFCGENPEACR